MIKGYYDEVTEQIKTSVDCGDAASTTWLVCKEKLFYAEICVDGNCTCKSYSFPYGCDGMSPDPSTILWRGKVNWYGTVQADQWQAPSDNYGPDIVFMLYTISTPAPALIGMEFYDTKVSKVVPIEYIINRQYNASRPDPNEFVLPAACQPASGSARFTGPVLTPRPWGFL